MDLAKRKKLVGLSKRDRTQSQQTSVGSSGRMLALVQDKLRHLEFSEEPSGARGSSLGQIPEYHRVRYIRHNLPDQPSSDTEHVPIELFGSVRSTVCSVM